MSFNTITEGSKEYIKYILQLNEQTPSVVTLPNGAPSGVTLWSDKPFGDPGRKRNPETGTSSFTFSGGAGGKGLNNYKGTGVPRDKDFYKRKENQGLQGPIMWGGSQIPGYVKRNKDTNEIEEISTDGGLGYLTSVGQAQSSLEFLDQMLPSIVKYGMAQGLRSQKVNQNPEDTKNGSTNPWTLGTLNTGAEGSTKTVNSGIGTAMGSALSSMTNDITNSIDTMIGDIGDQSPLAKKVMDYSKNLGPLDPYNPLMGLKIGVEMLGGKEILRRTRELGAVQTAGAASAMGHPSGFRGY